MQRIFFLLMAVLFDLNNSWATVHVNMFPSPIIIIHQPGAFESAADHSFYIMDSINALDFVIATNVNGVNLSFTETIPTIYYTETDSGSYNATLLDCSDSIIMDSTRWQGEATLAKQIGDANFDNKGVNYIAFRSKAPNGYNYGWFKLSCSITGDTLTIYGYGYNDEVSLSPNILIGQGDCIAGVSALGLPNNIVKCVNGVIELSYFAPMQVKMYDVQGRFMRAMYFEGGQASYNCSSFAHGLYFLEIESSDQRKLVRVVL